MNYYSEIETESTPSDRISIAESSNSRHSSIGGPYRQGWVDKSFPYCNPIRTPNDTADSFSRPLLSSGHGFPLWSPSGVNIGDVGVLNLEGDFTAFFNIFLPSYDQVQTDFSPSNFQPIQPPLREDELERHRRFFAPGTVIASKGIEVARVSSAPLSITFSSSAREGGIIVLPEGGEREDLTSTTRLQSYVRQNALEWYRHIRDYMEETIPNGSLYIITGCDKVSSCGVASISDRKTGGKTRLSYSEQDKNPWNSSQKARTRYYRTSGNLKHAAIFVRGMRVSLSAISWLRDLEYHVARRYRPYYDVLSTPVVGYRSRFLKLRERLLGTSTIPEIDAVQEPFHPSDLISQMLLEKSYSARVAIVEDSTWISVVNGDDCTLPRIVDLVLRVFQTHSSCTKNCLAFLVRRSQDGSEVEEPNCRICIPCRPPTSSEDRKHVERIITLRQ